MRKALKRKVFLVTFFTKKVTPDRRGQKSLNVIGVRQMKFNDYWNIPKNTKEFFSPKGERKLKEQYGIYYTLHNVFSAIILFVPLVIFFIIIPENAFNPISQIDNVLGGIGGFIGLIGSLSVGVGLVNIFMIFIKQYLGHWVTLISVLGGILLDLLALFLFSFVG